MKRLQVRFDRQRRCVLQCGETMALLQVECWHSWQVNRGYITPKDGILHKVEFRRYRWSEAQQGIPVLLAVVLWLSETAHGAELSAALWSSFLLL